MVVLASYSMGVKRSNRLWRRRRLYFVFIQVTITCHSRSRGSQVRGSRTFLKSREWNDSTPALSAADVTRSIDKHQSIPGEYPLTHFRANLGSLASVNNTPCDMTSSSKRVGDSLKNKCCSHPVRDRITEISNENPSFTPHAYGLPSFVLFSAISVKHNWLGPSAPNSRFSRLSETAGLGVLPVHAILR